MASYIQLEPSSFQALGVPTPTFGGTESFFGTSLFIYTLLFTAIIGAAFYEFILAGFYRMQASENGIRKSNETFKRTTLGLLGVFSLFLIIALLNKNMLTGDVGLSAVKVDMSKANSGGQISTMAPSPIPVSGTPVGNGVLASRIYSAAIAAKDTLSTANAAGTSGGRKACAYAVNVVLNNAGIAGIDRNGNLSVASMENGLRSGRGTLINQQDTVAGDIVIEAGTSHVGICLENGCKRVISNSSSKASFSWVSGPDFKDSYSGGIGRFYRVNN